VRVLKGFSLVELMVTLTIGAVVLAIGVPALGDMYRNNAVRSKANEVLALLQFCRSEAIKQQANLLFSVSDTANGWQVVISRQADASQIRVAQMTEAELSAGGTASFTFDNRGRVNAAGCISVSHSASSQFDRAVRVVLSGQSTVSAGGCE